MSQYGIRVWIGGKPKTTLHSTESDRDIVFGRLLGVGLNAVKFERCPDKTIADRIVTRSDAKRTKLIRALAHFCPGDNGGFWVFKDGSTWGGKL